MLQLSVVHRLPQLYRWSADQLGEIELLETTSGINDEDLVALRLLSHEGTLALDILQQLRETLAQIQVECKIARCEGHPCLLIQRINESAASCCLKNQGVAIAEDFNGR
ncbi:hypothetical protein C1Y41_07985 [Pantoea sp. ICBG 1758]|jgi:hypothetical protein|uniref:hypothetical protein n=1 Tax=Pantoea TaxID=53335 RepID=UPI0008FD3823|nr:MULTISPECIES: hypothetical protein [Pantoea]MCL9647555.1 hypothetical protein [Pantoea eucrina]MDJ0023250.1 hypothetical protein [Pantoea eucrina]NIE70653.1 hypothetical protein [Pantoea sp. Acro-807]OIX99119.1 hypothetical protein BFS13_12190 [Pantoea sp. Ae16]PPC64552.1 hypothetical protein C1Y41_07985 [Pantoea sp. ICBG 1758]